MDTNDDRRVSLDEFKAAADMMKSWGIDVTDPEARFRECDADGKGMVLFNEFSDWAIKQSLDLDDDLEMTDFEPDAEQPPAEKKAANKRRMQKVMASVPHEDGPEPIW